MSYRISFALDMLSIAVLAVILLCSRHLWRYDTMKRRLLVLNLSLIAFLLTDGAFAFFYGEPEAAASLMFFKTMYFLLNSLLILEWTSYVGAMLRGRAFKDHSLLKLYMGTFVLNGLMCLINPYIPLFFTVSEKGLFEAADIGMWVFTWLNFLCLSCSTAFLLRNRKRMGSRLFLYLLLVPIFPFTGEILGIVFPGLDLICLYTVSGVLLMEIGEADVSARDALTGLFNRKLAVQTVNRWLMPRRNCRVGVLLLDIEGLRRTNEVYGHEAGDRLLQRMADLLRDLAAEGYLAARLGGDEFALIWKDKEEDPTDSLRERVEQRQKEMNAGLRPEEQLRFAWGSAGAKSGDLEAEELLRLAGQQLYDRKEKLSREIEDALMKERFVVYYQPIWSVSRKCFTSAEALVRMVGTDGRIISPAQFIPAAEKNGQIHKIGSFVLNEVCCFMSSPGFEELGLEYIEVNMSVEQCMRENLVEKTLAILHSHGVGPEKINLEVTETALSLSQTRFTENLQRITEAGLGLSLDDFGSGYSNLQRLSEIPLSLVKLDKSFADALASENSETVGIMTRHIIAIVKEMDKLLVAEGVETGEQARYYAEMGCEYIQGYYYAKPMDRESLIRFLKER